MSLPPNDSTEAQEPADGGSGCSEPDCSDAVAELYTYLDGHLDDDRRTLIRGHLDDCSPCFKAFDFETELRAVIAAKCKDQVPESLRAKIEQALSQET